MTHIEIILDLQKALKTALMGRKHIYSTAEVAMVDSANNPDQDEPGQQYADSLSPIVHCGCLDTLCGYYHGGTRDYECCECECLVCNPLNERKEAQMSKTIHWQETTSGDRDALVAEKVMGVHAAYTTDMNAAWQIVRRINKPDNLGKYDQYARFIEEMKKVVGSDMFFDLFYCDQEGCHLDPDRICLSALRAMGFEVEA